ncbi:hypothetical protein [Burkholderia sp. Tr-20390]|uniref:hypothetical protein n=1 Tax=Burkholderia sp. Tr-20390 TaxID=2703904 RepID=UPI00197F1159|nr:hypothetical protein [Burkholderia sp. Tr-20390]MBN3729474.1 hypothetical protein [Burkholderia sp. Tr-20390]
MSENTLFSGSGHATMLGAPSVAAHDGPLERPFSVVIAELATVRPMVDNYIQARGGAVNGGTYAEMLSFAATIFRESRAMLALAWERLPATPPVEALQFYGEQFSAMVLLNDGEQVLPLVARWDFVEQGWVGADFADGPSPQDYEWLNKCAKYWMLLSAIAAPADARPAASTHCKTEVSCGFDD